ncbi:LysR family transcriptional regulator [Fodinicurvata fenggangensis]|uniref:LysR family transcriptional regulator n=1 Tax=Fodinicurvata fenggangensis TaxID=1121830 RepID=UPI000552CE7F|nr:LysR family transcriptional regulator [Fodinicurvata fenggangensis]
MVSRTSDLTPDATLLKSFLILAEELNFRRTAERLAIDQSALSRRIKKLESLLDYKLLERTTRDVALTAAGQELCKGLTPVLTDYAHSVEAARRVAEGKTGRVRVAYMAFAATEMVPQTVARFQQQYPDIDLELRYIRTQGQKMALANDEIDLGYMIGPFDNAEYHSLQLADERLYVVTPKNHALLRKHTLSPRDLKDEKLVLGDMEEWGEYRWKLEDVFSQHGMRLSPALEATNTLALIGLVAAGLGITIYPESLLNFLGRRVEARPVVHPDFRSKTVLVWKRSNRSRAVLNFVEVSRHLQVRG